MRTRARGKCCLTATALGAECAQSAHFFIHNITLFYFFRKEKSHVQQSRHKLKLCGT